MGLTYDSSAYEIFRGIHNARSYSWQDKPESTPIMDSASVFKEENKAPLTTALEDFSEKFKSFHGENRSNISAKDAKKSGWQSFLENIGFKKVSYNNMYETPEMQEHMNENGNIFQSDIFADAKAAEGGLRYAQEGDDIYEAALNFARADIGAIEKSFYTASVEGKANGKLTLAEINSSLGKDVNSFDLEYVDLDGDPKTITAEEYASYLLVADGAFKGDNALGLGYDPSSVDGLITDEEAQVISNYSDLTLQEYAQKIYNEHYANKDKK